MDHSFNAIVHGLFYYDRSPHGLLTMVYGSNNDISILQTIRLFANFARNYHGLSTMDHGLTMTKHEIIPCDRCGTSIECKANSYSKCQCSVVQLTINEVQYISENYEGCMCAKCLLELQVEYREMMGIGG